MTAQIIDGKAIAKQHLLQLQTAISQQATKPGLAVVIVGDNPASKLYVEKKYQAAKDIGVISHDFQLPTETTQAALLDVIESLNHNQAIHGILVQLPLPSHIDALAVIEAIDPRKDVDGFHPYNLGLLAARKPLLRPCTPYGIIRLLEHEKVNLTGMNAVIVGASNIVGRPMALELLLKGATITVCHRFTHDLESFVKNADLLIACAGKAHLIKGNWIKQDAIVIDVGINRLENGKIVGDVEYDVASKKARLITPVPGGVGPMTVAMLMENTYQAYINTRLEK
jgi:methylenetetrahydrofolate dehydrogenase (NADP+)/methenyltetrahydrofolate cyclohydrolase